jgi:flagellar biogenesis protein FliO
MRDITRQLVKKLALRLISMFALALFFCERAGCAALAADVDVPVPGMGDTLAGYVGKMSLALLLFGVAGYAAAKYLPRFFRAGNSGALRVISALSLGRDAVYVFQAGPDVIALFVGKGGATLLGRWPLDEWEDYEASLSPQRADTRAKDGG